MVDGARFAGRGGAARVGGGWQSSGEWGAGVRGPCPSVWKTTPITRSPRGANPARITPAHVGVPRGGGVDGGGPREVRKQPR
eukprot:11228329-Lingulodinium_polyedra.AAC.2